MKTESTRYLGLLEKRLALLESLARALAASRTDFISMDLEAIERRIAEQEHFCAQIRSLDAEITRAQILCAERAGVPNRTDEISWPGSPDAEIGVAEQIRKIMVRISAAQVELKKLNDAHEAMLRRSRGTVNILLNLFQSYAPTYAAPVSPAAGAIYEERV